MEEKPFFYGKSPCSSCPYRKDAPRQLWDKYEFDKLLKEDKEIFGGTYKCHKNNGSCCKGWLMNQDERNFPNIALRIMLTKHNVTRVYLDSLRSKTPLFDSIDEMREANYPS